MTNKKELLEQLLDNPDVLLEALSVLKNKKVQSNDYHYQCSNCEHELTSEKKRKRCPSCGKHKLVEVSQVEEAPKSSPKQDLYDSFNVKLRPDKKRGFKYDEEGNIIGKYTESRLPSVEGNNFKDSGELFKEDTEFQRKVTKTAPIERRSKPRYKKVVCRSCDNEYKVLASLCPRESTYLCDKCVIKGPRRDYE